MAQKIDEILATGESPSGWLSPHLILHKENQFVWIHPLLADNQNPLLPYVKAHFEGTQSL